SDLVEQFLSQFYAGQAELAAETPTDGVVVPREVLVPELPANAESMEQWLSELRGSRVRLRVPQRGDKRTLAETVARNAEEAFSQHKLRRAGDLTARSAALSELQEYLGLDSAPLRIECVDVSYLAGTDVVASLVAFEGWLPRKSAHRRLGMREPVIDGAGAVQA